MEKWEANLQQVDTILYRWMKETGITVTTPVACISILENEGIYKPTERPGKPFRDDLRSARKYGLPYETTHLRFEQDNEKSPWYIYRKTDY